MGQLVFDILKNADTAFDNRNYRYAFDLYSQALNIDSENIHAILYRALASAWLSTMQDLRISQLGAEGEKAFYLEHSQVGDSRDYFIFAEDALNKVSEVTYAVFNLYYQKYLLELAQLENNTSFRGTNTAPSRIEKDILTDKAEREMATGAFDCYAVSNDFLSFILYSVADYTESSDTFWYAMGTLMRNAFKYREFARTEYDNGLDSKREIILKLEKSVKNQKRKREAERIEKEHLERNEKYWAEHASLKMELESEKAALESKLAELKPQYEEILIIRNERVEELRKIREKKLREEEACDKLQDQIREMERQRDKLGMFKRNQKKELQICIDQDQRKLEDLKKAAQKAKEKHREAINEQIKEAQQYKEDTADEYITTLNRISEITNELTKNR